MISLDRIALTCDLAETYGLLNWEAVPVATLAMLAVGLRENSRIKMRLSGRPTSTETLLQAAALDRLSTLVWFQTEDGQAGRNRPKSLVAVLLGETQETKHNVRSYETSEEFEHAWRSITGVAHG